MSPLGTTVGIRSPRTILGLAVGPLGCREGGVEEHQVGEVGRLAKIVPGGRASVQSLHFALGWVGGSDGLAGPFIPQWKV